MILVGAMERFVYPLDRICVYPSSPFVRLNLSHELCRAIKGYALPLIQRRVIANP